MLRTGASRRCRTRSARRGASSRARTRPSSAGRAAATERLAVIARFAAAWRRSRRGGGRRTYGRRRRRWLRRLCRCSSASASSSATRGACCERAAPRRDPLWLRHGRRGRARAVRHRADRRPRKLRLDAGGVQAVHALTAGNAVIVKPAPGHRALLRLRRAARDRRPAPGCLRSSMRSPTAATRCSSAASTSWCSPARAERAASSCAAASRTLCRRRWNSRAATPVSSRRRRPRPSSPRSVRLTLNAGRTCLAPRRVIAPAAVCAALERRSRRSSLRARRSRSPRRRYRRSSRTPLAWRARSSRASADRPDPLVLAGVTPRMAIFSTEVFAPVLLISAAESSDDAVELANRIVRSRSASRSSAPRRHARELVPPLAAGVSMINDVIVPTAHPERCRSRRAGGAASA